MAWHISIDEPKNFEMLRPLSLDEALEWATKHGPQAAFLAGGCDLLDQLKNQWSTYRYVINLKTIPGLKGVTQQENAIRIGALMTLGEIERDVQLRKHAPGLVMAASRVATPQIRNMGTLGGNLLQDSRCPYYRGPWYCYRAGGIVCDARHGINVEHAIFGGDRCYTVTPSDAAPMLVALDAELRVRGLNGQYDMPVHKLFTPPGENIRAMHRLEANEVLTEIVIPRRTNQRSTFIKYAPRNAWDFAQASVAVAMSVRNGVGKDCRVVLGAVAPTPWRSRAAEEAIEGRPLNPSYIEAAARAAVEGAEPLEHNAYKITLVKKLVREALTQLSA
jgi:xanthine dehydrogenase YagS FAD-binding subunit